MAYKIKIEQFEGPLDLLLQLIEGQEMDITKVALSTVTDQYLTYINESADITTEELADFLVVAAKLLLIKSRLLLPQLQLAEDEGNDLEKQLKIYKEYYEASLVLHKMLLKKKFLFSRERPAVTIERIFNPPKTLTVGKLRDLFAEVLSELQVWVNLPTEIIARTISIRERIASIQEEIGHQATMTFRTLLKSAKNKTEIIVTFLAVLELVKQRIVVVVQERVFDDIVVKKVENQDNI